jgi:hypothetical protein
MKTPSARALALALVPFVAMCFSVGFWDRVEPLVLGLPFNLIWLIVWILLTPCCMWLAYRVETGSAPRRSTSHE